MVSRESQVGITLIHGTFARRASWTGPDGAFAQRLTETLDGATRMLPPFSWTGRNSHDERVHAADQLAAVLIATDTPQFLIAHSHGGNVALQALANENARRRVMGLVCLNTPFIHVRRRDLSTFTLLLMSLHPMGWWIWLTVGLYLFHFRYVYPGEALQPSLIALLWSLPAVAAGLIAKGPFNAAMTAGVDAIENHQARRAAFFTGSPAPPVPILCLTVARDEAYWLLRTVDLVSWTLKLPAYAALGMLGLGWVATEFVDLLWLIGQVAPPAWTWSQRLYSVGAIGMMIGVASYFTSLAMMVLVMPLIRGHIMSYGERPGDSAVLDFGVRSYPPGADAAAVQVVAGTGGLRHSSLYASPDVIRRVSAWINGRLTASPPAGA